jgi:RIO kinase 1
VKKAGKTGVQRPDAENAVTQPAVLSPQPSTKQSYESSAEVQRWLQEQDLGEGRTKPPFEPTLLAGKRDRDWVLSSLAHFYEQDLIADVLHVVSSGKEATVYCCAAHPASGAECLAAKIYRPRIFRSLRNDALYRESRAGRDERGRPLRDRRRRRGGERGRADQVAGWIEHEFRTHRRLYEAGAAVPRPLAQVGNAVLMEYVGARDEPAPLLHQVRLAPEEARPLFERLLRDIELFLACDCIHGDLSAYNVLYWRGAVTIIDFAQAVDPRYNPEVYPLLERDIERVCRYFARYGVVADAGALAAELWVRYLGGETDGGGNGWPLQPPNLGGGADGVSQEWEGERD